MGPDWRFRRRHRSLLTLIVLVIALVVPVAAHASETVTLSLAPTTLSASGGLVAVTAHFSSPPGAACSFHARESTRLWPCSSPAVMRVAPNQSANSETVTLDVTITDGASVSYASADVTLAGVQPGAYVALGDSYAAGEGNPGRGWVDRRGVASATASATDGCDRSSIAYPELVARWLADQARSAPLSFLACSGATTTDLYPGSPAASAGLAGPGGNHEEGPQLADAAELSTAQVVTVTIGGNDLYFVPVLFTCVTIPDWCATNSPVPAVRDLRANITRLGGALAATLHQVRVVAPLARIVVVSYPRLVPVARALTRATLSRGCAGLRGEALLYLSRAETALNNVITRAANTNGLSLANPNEGAGSFASGGGHSLCGARPWFNPLDLRHPRYSFHPNAAGQRAMASAVEAALRS
ncbi:MAG TPA: SGNH/GDSL hydrolase family protein [Acidimicrobiales bacterium]|nr:SGNH/GDSL hydrolase family protein [Acidimicrobiales bacterium]